MNSSQQTPTANSTAIARKQQQQTALEQHTSQFNTALFLVDF